MYIYGNIYKNEVYTESEQNELLYLILPEE